MFREARRGDIRRMVEMLADDDLGRARESLDDMTPYEAAFDAITADPGNTIYVWEADGKVMGCLQLTFIPGLSYKGALAAQVEGVRVDASLRGQGIGEKMMKAVIEFARNRGCNLVQLSSNKARTGAHRFYERLGFVMSHEGMKLKL